MGLFNRNKDTDKRSVDQQTTVVTENGYTVPVGIGFLDNYIIKGSDLTKLSAGFAAIDLISSKIASIPIYVKAGSKYGERVDHSFNHVWDTSLMSKFITIKQLVWDTLVYGNGIAYINRADDGTVIDIIYVPYGDYSIIYNEVTHKLYYMIPTLSKKKIEPINVIHIIKNTRNGVVGLGVDHYSRNTVYLSSITDKSAASFFDNGCAVSGILKSSKVLDTEKKLDAKKSWLEALGPGKNGGIAVLGNDFDYQQVGATSSDTQLLESRQFNIREIARFLGIPPELIGDDTNKAYNSLEQAIQALITFTLSPFISILEEEFNRKCLKPSERREYVIDFAEEELIVSDKSTESTYLKTLVDAGIMTRNEARRQLGLPPVDGADDLVIPFTDISQNTIGSAEEPDENE